MRESGGNSKQMYKVLFATAGLLFASSCLAEQHPAPRRVVSLNLCTDQLAMMLAKPGQLHSVTWLASKPDASVLADQASQYVPNRGLAEEILLMHPDLVLASTYTARATVSLLRRLGFQVEEFEPANSFEQIRKSIRRLALLLGNEPLGEKLVRDLDAHINQRVTTNSHTQRVALYYSNSYTSGAGTLVDEVIAAAGLRNVGREMGYTGVAKLPLELLVIAQPDIVAGQNRSLHIQARSEEMFVHPAYRSLRENGYEATIQQKYWNCGGPFTLNAVRSLQAAADQNSARGREKADD